MRYIVFAAVAVTLIVAAAGLRFATAQADDNPFGKYLPPFSKCMLEQMRGQVADMQVYAMAVCQRQTGKSPADGLAELNR